MEANLTMIFAESSFFLQRKLL